MHTRPLRPLSPTSLAAAPSQQYQDGLPRRDPILLLDSIRLGALYFKLYVVLLFNLFKDKIDAYLYGCY